MKKKDVISIIEAYDLLEGRNTMTSRQDSATICDRILEIRDRFLSSNMIFRKPTIETDQLYRGLDSLYVKLYSKFELGKKFELDEELRQ